MLCWEGRGGEGRGCLMLYCEAGIVVSIINFKDRLNDSNSIKKK